MTASNKDDALSIDHVKQIAHLARIQVNESESEQYTHDLNRILHLMDTLSDIDTKGLDPMASPHAVSQPLRFDESNANINRDALMQNAPDAQNGLFKVPKVIE